jgi:hypothetical protein
MAVVKPGRLQVICRQVTLSASPRYFGTATMGRMALIVFFRGINVGGHRAFRPSMLAKDLGSYDVVNVGAAGTLVVYKPGSRAKFVAELRRKLRFEATIAFCDASDLIGLERDKPFGTEPPHADIVQFVRVLAKGGRARVSLPIALPEVGEWLVRIIGSKNGLVYGEYRRHMKQFVVLARSTGSLGRGRQRAVGAQCSPCCGFSNPASAASSLPAPANISSCLTARSPNSLCPRFLPAPEKSSCS